MINNRIKGKTVVITGATGGLGEQLAIMCAQNGAQLFLIARNEDKLNTMAEHIRHTYGVPCTVLPLDLSQHHHIPNIFQKILADAGTIDVLVNNAGYGIFEAARDVKMEDVEGMFAVNVVGLIACTNQVLDHMCTKRAGHIINIASQAGKLATPKSSVYSATKHAVLGYTNSLRMEMSQYGVYVTAVNPGPIRTQFFQIADPGGSYLESLGRYMLDVQKVAGEIVKVMLSHKREINMPRWMNMSGKLHTLMPAVVERVGRKAFFKK